MSELERHEGLELDEVADDPYDQFALWFGEARSRGLSQPEAMTVATVDAEGLPDARTVLLRGVVRPPAIDSGFQFFTNYLGTKGQQLAVNPRAALLFHWEPMERQVRIRGGVHRASEATSDAYFGSRPRRSQLGAWASPQSQPIASRETLEQRVAAYGTRFETGEVPRPPHWGGFVVVPETIEFWQGRAFRLHDRIRYVRAGDGWTRERLAP